MEPFFTGSSSKSAKQGFDGATKVGVGKHVVEQNTFFLSYVVEFKLEPDDGSGNKVIVSNMCCTSSVIFKSLVE